MPDGAPTQAAAIAGERTDETAFLRALGERLRLLRARRGMTRSILSRQSGISERYIAQMEAGNGNVSVLLLRSIARALDVPPTELLSRQTEPASGGELERLLERLSEDQRDEAQRMLLARFGAISSASRKHRVALIGLRGAGKSTLGRRLAEARDMPFHELDREIERSAGLGLREIFELHGQPGFRRLERSVLERLVATGEAMVIATGGGIVAEPDTYTLLLRTCFTVWVRTTPEEHMRRVIDQHDMRPMQDNRQSMADLRSILASREVLYARADAVLDTSGHSVDESLRALQRLFGPLGD